MGLVEIGAEIFDVNCIGVAEQERAVFGLQFFQKSDAPGRYVEQHRVPAAIDVIVIALEVINVPDGLSEFFVADQTLFVLEKLFARCV